MTGDERAQARNKSSKSGPFFDVLNNLFVRAVRFSITKRVDNAHLKYEPTNLLFLFFVASNSTNQLC